MSKLTRINPEYKEKLSYGQERFLESGVGVKFFNEFVFRKGNHLFIVGNTGSGKTQKSYFIMDFLKHTENQIWISTAKSDEILPLLCMGKKVRIIVPKYAELDIEENLSGKWIPYDDNLEIVRVASASDSWDAVKTSWDENRNKAFDTINIFEFRQTISEKNNIRSKWMIELFDSLAQRTRSGTIPSIFPCTIYLDEAQWLLAGRRITFDKKRLQSGSIVIENVLEMRSAGCRFVMMAQSYKNIPPAIRENMLCTILCRGAKVESEENDALSYHCRLRPGPTHYEPHQGKFVHADGTSYPAVTPWEFPLYPVCSLDRKWIKGLRLRYGTKYGDHREEVEEECFPELGRFQALAIKPEVQAMVESRWNIPDGGIEDD